MKFGCEQSLVLTVHFLEHARLRDHIDSMPEKLDARIHEGGKVALWQGWWLGAFTLAFGHGD